MGFKKGNKICIGREPWNKGLTKEIDERIKLYSDKRIGKNNPNWKGDKIKSFSALHNWVRRHKPKSKKCEICKKNKPYDMANISGKYKRDINDYRWLCRSCHMKEDGRMKKLIKSRIKAINIRTKRKFEVAKKLREKGYTYEEISKRLNYSNRGGVWNLLNKYGKK